MIKDFTRADIQRIAPLQPEGWSDIRTFFEFYVAAPFCFPLKLEAQDKIAAIGAVMLNTESAWLAHIIVSPDHRREGIGWDITQRLIAIAEQHDRPLQLLIATAMGESLYEKAGFQRSCIYKFFQPQKMSMPEPHQHIRALEPGDLADIDRLDRRATGENRSKMLERFSAQGWVMTGQRNRIRGFYLPELGEGAIVTEDAGDSDAGKALMRLRLGVCGVKSVLPAGNAAALAYLVELGLELQSEASRMVRNGDDPLDQRLVFNRVGGHFG